MAASSDEFFRSPAFLAVEGATHTLRVGSAGRTAQVPLIVREVDDSDLADASSPYGYPGGLVAGEGEPPRPDQVDWSEVGLISIFARERLGATPWLQGATERSRVSVHDPAQPRAVRPRMAEQVRANRRDGWSVEVVAGPESASADRDAFALAYEQTMLRAGAAQRYFFSRAYLDAALSFERSWLLTARRGGEPAAGAISAVSDGVLHYFLGGTAAHAVAASPFKNVVERMLDLADELELPLNLGGGVRIGDGLERFKRGFANAELGFHTHELVCAPGEYERLSRTAAAGGYFPSYRSG
jgi:hypothetical protein